MNTFRIFLCITAFSAIGLQACHNPSEKGKKVKLKMTSKDTTAKKPDTLQPRERVNPQDSVRKY